MLIQGKCASAIAYANVIEPEAIEQIRRMCDYEFTAGSRIRIMPDVHAGKGCTIGTTMTIRDRACPNIVGVCSANTSAKALRGALRSGILTHIVARANLAQTLLS